MQVYTQQALATKIMTNSTIMTWIGNDGPNRLLSEGDATPQTTVPFIIMEYVGTKPIPETHDAHTETWIIRLYDKGKGFYNIEIMLSQLYRLFHNTSLTLNALSPDYCVQYGVRFGGMTPREYDNNFGSEYEGIIFDITLFDKMSDT